MPKLQKVDFFYGAALNMIFRYNKDAMTSMVETTDYKQVYRLTTNKSKQDFIMIMKHSAPNSRIKTDYMSWQFKLSDIDRECLRKYHSEHLPTFMMFVCLSENLSGSEIFIVNYEEIEPIIDKNSIIIGSEKHKNYALMFIEKAKANALHIPRNRIEKPFDEIVESVIKANPSHYCPNCGIKIS